VQKKTSRLVDDVRVTLPDGHVMTTYVEMAFDNFRLNASKQLNNATLLLHNKPVIKPPTSIVKIYANTSQIVQIEVCIENVLTDVNAPGCFSWASRCSAAFLLSRLAAAEQRLAQETQP